MEKLAKLAMLHENDAVKFTNDINEIIRLAEVLKNIEICELFDEYEGVLREDKAEKSMDRNTILSNAKCKKDGYIIIPKVMG